MRRVVKAFSLSLALAIGLGLSPRQPPTGVSQRARLDLRALSSDRLIGCGCLLTVAELGRGRAGWAPHFFSELHEGAPLWLNLGGREFSLRSAAAVTNNFQHARGDKWREDYEGENLKVRISYGPGKSTCPPEKADDCEYFDVNADIIVTSAGAGSKTYKGVGVCGC